MEINRPYHIRHSISGRLRVAFPALSGRREPISLMTQRLSDEKGITRLRTNYLCGSVILHYDPEILKPPVLLDMLEQVTRKHMPWSGVGLAELNETTVIEHGEGAHNRKKKGIRRLWNVAGTVSVGVGIAGVFLPLLPTVPMFLLAGFCYWRGSPRFYNRLVNFGPLGRLVDNFQKGKGLPARTKKRAIVFMWFSLVTSMVFFVTGTTLRMVLFLAGIGATIYILRIKTSDPLIAAPKPRGIPA